MPGALFALIVVWPWIDAWIRDDAASHQLLDRARDVPARTALGVAALTFGAGLTLAGSSDVQARYVHQSIVAITHFYQVFCLIAPVAAFVLTYAVASELRDERPEPSRVRLRRNARGGYEEEPLA